MIGLRLHEGSRASISGQTKQLATRAGLASRADVRLIAGRRQVLHRGRSARPMARFASPKDVGIFLGRSRGVECWASVEDSLILVGPPRSGKGLHQVIGAMLDAPGAVVTTSTRPDNLAATLDGRRTIGPVAIFDPQGLGSTEGIRWSPIRGCENATPHSAPTIFRQVGSFVWSGHDSLSGASTLELMERPETGRILYPEMRIEVISALQSLSDLRHQQTRWGRYEEGVNYYDDLTLNVHILYDDTLVLPTPETAVPSILHPAEVPALRAVDAALGPLLDELTDSSEAVYLADPRWAQVLSAASEALVVMEACDRTNLP